MEDRERFVMRKHRALEDLMSELGQVQEHVLELFKSMKENNSEFFNEKSVRLFEDKYLGVLYKYKKYFT